jgi:lipopolysaccharide export system protein LptC
MSHPLNWIIILLMLVIAGMFGHLLLTYFEQEPATANDTDQPAGYTTEQMQPSPDFGMYASLASSS